MFNALGKIITILINNIHSNIQCTCTIDLHNYKYSAYTRVVQKVLQMLGFHRYKRLILAKFVMLE